MHVTLATLTVLVATTFATPVHVPTTPAAHPLSKRDLCGHWSNQRFSYNAAYGAHFHDIPSGGACTNTDWPGEDFDPKDKFWFYISDSCDYCNFYT
jgi:hypothetical protein